MFKLFELFEPIAGEDFEPSRDVKQLWLYTRKSSFNVLGEEFPGLFTTKFTGVDGAAVVSVLFLEGWGLYNLLSITSASVWAIGGVVALFLLDLAFAFLRHLPASARCRLNNTRKLVAGDPKGLFKAEQKYKRIKWLAPIGFVLILALAAVKVYLFYELSAGVITGLTASVLVSYIIAATLHITNTGYFIFGTVFSFALTREHNKWRDETHPDTPGLTINEKRPYQFPESKTDIKETTADDHSIRKVKEDGKEYFLLETYGVLTDTQLKTLVNKQPSTSKREVALMCLEAQLDILDSNPDSKQKPAEAGFQQAAHTGSA